MKRIFAAGVVTLGMFAAATTAYSGGHAKLEKPIKARKAAMTLYSFNIGILAAMAKGEAEYDAKAAQAAANDLLAAVSLENGGAMWPQGSDVEALGKEVTRAKKEIWTTYPAVTEKSKAMKAAAEKMAAAAGGGLDSLKGALGPVGGGCKGCHDDFRAPKD